MSEYWCDRISNSFQCSNCGGGVVVTGAVPIVKGDITTYRCIRCSQTGSIKDKLAQDLRLRGLSRKE